MNKDTIELDERETLQVYSAQADQNNGYPPGGNGNNLPASAPNTPPTPSIWGYRLLWILMIISFALNALLLGGMFTFRLQAQQQVEQVRNILQTSQFEDISWNVQINEVLPVSITVPFSDTFQIPISMTIPISTSVLFEDLVQVPINTVLPINIREVGVGDIPFLNLEFIPLSTFVNVPVDLVVNVPISREIPVQTDIPISLLLEVPVSSTVPIEMEIPVILDIPVTVPLDELGFQKLLTQVEDALRLLAELLGAPPMTEP